MQDEQSEWWSSTSTREVVSEAERLAERHEAWKTRVVPKLVRRIRGAMRRRARWLRSRCAVFAVPQEVRNDVAEELKGHGYKVSNETASARHEMLSIRVSF